MWAKNGMVAILVGGVAPHQPSAASDRHRWSNVDHTMECVGPHSGVFHKCIEQVHSSMHVDMSTTGMFKTSVAHVINCWRSDREANQEWQLCRNRLVRVLQKYYLRSPLSQERWPNWLDVNINYKIFEWQILISITRHSRLLHKKLQRLLLQW